MNIPKDLKYTKEHEWVRADGNKAYIGITNYAQLALGDIVFVELPKVGKRIDAGDTLGVVESVKTASDVFSPVSGVVIDVNEALEAKPELMNQEPYEAWMAVIQMDNAADIDTLMDEEQYSRYCLKEG